VHFFQQLQLLQPDLLIVSLGSNEASNDYKVNVETFRSCVDSFVAIARVMLPNTPIILSTPAETYIRIRKKFDVNPNIHLVANTITHYAQENNIPCFDLFEATGGVNSSVNALDNNLLRKDRVHFNEQGYQQHASLLVNSILCLLDSYSSEKIF
jgi:lysophospholipase L1-like esterase